MTLADVAPILLAAVVALLGWLGKRALNSVEAVAVEALQKATEVTKTVAVNSEKIAEVQRALSAHAGSIHDRAQQQIDALSSEMRAHEAADAAIAERVGHLVTMLEEVRADVKALRERRQ